MSVLKSGKIIAALRGAFTREVGRQELLRLSAEHIRAAGPPYTSVYLYMLYGQELVLEAFAGRPTDHVRIPVGRGVCGTAVATGGTLATLHAPLASTTVRHRHEP